MKPLWIALGFLLLAGCSPKPEALSLNRGVNLEGLLQYPPFEALDTERLQVLKEVKDAGFDFVRVPINPQFFMDDQSERATASLKLLLETASGQQLKVVLDVFPEEDTLKLPVLQQENAYPVYLAFLEKMASLLKGQSHVALEPMDEPHDPTRDDCEPSAFDWNGMQGEMLKAIRRGNPTITVVLSGLCYSGMEALQQLQKVNDAAVIYTFHYFERPIFTQQGTDLYPYTPNLKNVPYPASNLPTETLLKNLPPEQQERARDRLKRYEGFDKNTILQEFQQVSQWARDNGVQVMLGAYGVHRNAPSADRERWLGDVREVTESLKIPHAVWAWDGEYGSQP